ncbi:hypothetical protein FOZ61_002790 [Perkinsus olseni]|uniref:Uncharacterized protein n=1 Tax=Perkinsus olseni TaxID=32597 RepID=A0A7J6LRW5_PEROL|nr:hypothetical protein FOZ61_002790 [Perkinsus olseni]KAF4669261.1 hypothetical protein FOL46_001521 [Perkinsus olseni]
MFTRHLLTILAMNIGGTLGTELRGTYCHNKTHFPYPKLPFDTFCVTINQGYYKTGKGKLQLLKTQALLRYTTDESGAWVEAPRIPLKPDTGEFGGSSVDFETVDDRSVENKTELVGWLNRAADLLQTKHVDSLGDFRIYPKPKDDTKITLALGKYHLVLEREKNDVFPAKASDTGRVQAGTYKIHGRPGRCLTTTVVIREGSEALEAQFTFTLLDGSKVSVGPVTLKGDRVLRVDTKSLDSLDLADFQFDVSNVGWMTDIPKLTLDTIAVEPDGHNAIWLHLGETADGFSAEWFYLPKM